MKRTSAEDSDMQARELARHEEYFQRRPWERPPRQLDERELAGIVDHIHEPYYFEKRVVHAKLRREYGDQVEKYIRQKAGDMPNMSEGRRWAEHSIARWKQEAVPQSGYDWDETDARLLTTAKYASGRPSLNRSFSLTVESTQRAVRVVGRLILVMGIAFVLWKGYQLKKALDDMAAGFNGKLDYYSSPDAR